ncbi:hypothetical protein BWQ96_08394 [Gracilariopsis chorda]|uniref:Tyr recombinase domain-containing protein n=1 Tax=Gracilariopsis chorda TaxID=448386 RepID=A0A2V3IIJ4_9FLOR|nr:hypothetical protein BWQ96_08394 [Gracilariopsis chorda]|eukprot:PXF41892.1 hypothetical protein BWQ96_08394 [Gracilariopsis chorda]
MLHQEPKSWTPTGDVEPNLHDTSHVSYIEGATWNVSQNSTRLEVSQTIPVGYTNDKTNGTSLRMADANHNLNQFRSSCSAFNSHAEYVRASEALNLFWSEVAFPGDVGLSSFGPTMAGKNIKDAKTSKTTGRLQSVPINDQTVIKFLRAYQLQNRSNHHFAPNVSYKTYLSPIKTVSSSFGLSHGRFSTHSARIGKATEEYVNNLPVQQIAINGRWKSLNSLRYYLDNGKSWPLNSNISDSQQSLIRSYAAKLLDLIHSP